MESDFLGIGTGLLLALVVAALAALWISSLISIFRRSTSMSGLELIARCALVIFAQFIGPLIWFFVGRDRCAAPPS